LSEQTFPSGLLASSDDARISQMIRSFSVLIVAALVAAGAAPAASSTKADIYRAFTSSGKPAIKITKTVKGTCNGGSAAVNRSDAWRCFAGNFVYDPCFSSTEAKGILVCPGNPWNTSAVELKVSGKLRFPDKGKPSTSGMPWAIQTTTGLKCVIATGATTVLQKQRLNYFCVRSKDGLWGSPSRKHEPWTIHIAPPSATKLSKTVAIKTAWF
jgi:hypothetical protein